jgi:hypothetical protein
MLFHKSNVFRFASSITQNTHFLPFHKKDEPFTLLSGADFMKYNYFFPFVPEKISANHLVFWMNKILMKHVVKKFIFYIFKNKYKNL